MAQTPKPRAPGATVLNRLGWVDSLIDPRGQVQRFTFDKNGNVRIHTNRRGQQVQFAYDQRDRVVSITANGAMTTFSYDSSAKWMAAANGESTDTLELSAEGRVTQAVIRRGSLRYVLTTTFDRAGWRNALKLAGPWGTRELGFGHDALLRFSHLKDHRGQWTSVRYNREHLPDTVTIPTGNPALKQGFTYTPGHLPAGIGFNLEGVELPLGRRYTYDVLDRIITARRGQDPTETLFGDVVKRYVQYDALGRLARYDDVREWQEEGDIICPDPFDLESCYRERIDHADTLRSDAFTYDQVGNRTDKGAVLETGNRLTAFNGWTLEYDADGNLTRKVKSGVGDYSLTWNSLGQLIEVLNNGTGVTTEFGYDAFGRRVRKTTWIGTTPSTTRYLWDGHDLVAELDGAGNPIREYAYFPGIDRPHSVRRASDGAVFYYLSELPGHVTGLVNPSNQVVNSYAHTPWGEPITAAEQVAQPLRYMAREYDAETQLFFVRARYYDPALGRFISEDPIGLAGGINPFTYSASDPVNQTDPLGLDENACPAGSELIRVVLNAVYNGKQGIGYQCQTADGEVFWVFASNEYLDAAIQLNPIVVRAEPCLRCTWFNPSERGARRQEMLNTLDRSNGVTSFTMSGIDVQLWQAPGPAGDDLLMAVCKDAAYTVQRGDAEARFGVGLAFMSMAFFRSPRKYKGPSPSIIGMGPAWAMLESGGNRATLGYSVHQALGCGLR